MESLYVSYHKVASNWTENHHWYCQYILIISAYIPNSILLSIYICIISKVGIVCPNSFHLTYVSWNKERSNHFICPITKALQTELKTITDFPTYFNFFPTIFLTKFFFWIKTGWLTCFKGRRGDQKNGLKVLTGAAKSSRVREDRTHWSQITQHKLLLSFENLGMRRLCFWACP